MHFMGFVKDRIFK